MNHRKLLILLACIVSAAIMGCDAGSFTAFEQTSVPVTVAADLSDFTAVAGVAVEVTGPGIPSPIVANLPITDGVATGALEVLAGSERVFSLRAYDAQAVETHRGQETVDITGESSPTIQVTLAPLTGDVDIDGRIGGYTVSVSPSSATLAIGATTSLEVSVVDAFGNVVSDAQIVWGAANPSVASVDAAGTVEAHVTGETSVVASYRGFAAAATITVQ